MQIVQQILGFDRQRPHADAERVQVLVHADDAVHRLRRCGERQRGAAGAVLVAGERARPGRRRPAQRLDVPETAPLGLEREFFLLARVGAVDLAQLPLEQVQLAIARSGALLELVQALAKPSFAHIDLAVGLAAAGLVGAGEAVEDLELRRVQHQLAALVLAVERQQRRARLAQIGGRGAAPAQVGPCPALGAHAAREHEFLGVLRDPVAQQHSEFFGQREDALDVRLRGAGAHDARPRLAAEEQIQRVGEHRLARARLPREHVQARTEAQLGPFDQEEILDAQFVKHVEGSTSGAGRIAREARQLLQNWHTFGTDT